MGGLELTNCEIMTQAEGGRPNDKATQVAILNVAILHVYAPEAKTRKTLKRNILGCLGGSVSQVSNS